VRLAITCQIMQIMQTPPDLLKIASSDCLTLAGSVCPSAVQFVFVIAVMLFLVSFYCLYANSASCTLGEARKV